VLDESGIAIGEPIPIAALGESGHLSFPCIAQALKGGVRLQVHLDDGRLRIFAQHGAEVTDDPGYLEIARAFGSLRYPRRGIFDCVHSPGRSAVYLVECISWDGGTTFRLPLRERLALMDGIEAGPNLKVVNWRIVESPLDMYGFTKKAVVKAIDEELRPQDHGWLIAKPKHVQPGRAAPWALCAGGDDEVPHIAYATTAESAFDLLDVPPAGDVPLVVVVCDRGTEALQIHQVGGEVRVYRDTYNSAETVDSAEAACYDGSSEEDAGWTLNVLREPNGEIIGVDCLAEGNSSLHTVPYSARMRLLKNRVAPTLDWTLSSDPQMVSGIDGLREAVSGLKPNTQMIVRRADALCEIPMLEVIVRTG